MLSLYDLLTLVLLSCTLTLWNWYWYSVYCLWSKRSTE